MDPAVAQIIVTSITVCVAALVTIVSTKSVKKQANKHSTRSDIMQLIIEDYVREIKGKPPENYQAILDEYDEYKGTGGNSYIHEKVEEYKRWHKDQEGGKTYKRSQK